MRLLDNNLINEIAKARIEKSWNRDLSQLPESFYSENLEAEVRLLTALAHKACSKFPLILNPTADYQEIVRQAKRISWKVESGFLTYPESVLSIETQSNEKLMKEKLKKQHRELCEFFVRLHDPHRSPYVSWIAKSNRMQKDIDADNYASKTQLVNKHGSIIKLPTQEEIANRQYAMLLARGKGVISSAVEQGVDDFYLITITAPTEFHPLKKNVEKNCYEPNPQFNPDLSVRDSHLYLQQGWARFRANVAKTGSVFEFVKAVQPHSSSTAHIHIVVGTTLPKSEIQRFLTLNFDGDASESRAKFGIKVDKMKHGADGAMAYISRTIKYLARAMAGESSEDAEEAMATKEWASIFRIRRFTTSQDAVTVWKTILKPECDIPVLKPVIEARKAGDYYTFLKHVKALDIKPLYAKNHTASGTESKKVIGLSIGDVPLVKFEYFFKDSLDLDVELQLVEKNQGTQHRSKKKLLALVERLRNFPLLRQKYLHILEAHYKDVAIA